MTAAVPLEELTNADRSSLDSALLELAEGAARWATRGLAERASLLEQTRASILEASEEWATAAIRAKLVPPGPLEGEEWISGPYATIAGFDRTAQTLRRLEAGRSPVDGLKVATAPGGRLTLRVMPSDFQQFMLLNGFTGDIWMPPGVTLEQVRETAGLGAKRIGENGGVGLVLGAGNIAAIGPLDVLYELVAFNRASILKLNPTFAGLLPAYERALEPLIRAGVLRIVNGGAAVGAYLANHADVSHVHITGSGLTHDAIVWGVGEEAKRRRADNDPKLTKPISSELGGVGPVIVVPGKWSKADIAYQAEHVATMRLHNGGHNCVAGQMLVLSSEWAQREQFLSALRGVLDKLTRAPWYPGTDRKVASAEHSYPAAERHGVATLVEVSADGSQDACTTEYFSPVLAHTSLPGTGAAFLNAAVRYANDRLDGTLGANIIIAPADKKAVGAAFDQAVADLRYGTIAINVWTGLAFLAAGMPWGAFPGHTIREVGSGIGVVHNANLVDNTERAVVRGAFRPFPRSVAGGEASLSPKAPWFVTNKTAAKTGRLLANFAGEPSWAKMPRIFLSAFRG
jgi:acyl-CoA reductase-like NAD-dependent aldehyde dehydrogenase